METQVLTVTSKGQISLPVEMRRRLSINTGDKLVAYSEGDTIMLKTIKIPSVEECKAAMDEAQKWVSDIGLKEEEFVNDFIKEIRRQKREKQL